MSANRAQSCYRDGATTGRRPRQRRRDRADPACRRKEGRCRDCWQRPQQLERDDPNEQRQRQGKGERDREISPLLSFKPDG